MQQRDMGARLQLVLSVDHDLLVALEAGINESLAIADLRDLDWADGHGAVWIDDVGVGSFRALLHDRGGYGQAVMPRIQEQPRVDELARPEPLRLVGKIRLELDRAGRLQDLVVDEAKRAFIQLDRIVLAVGENRERPLGLFLLLLNLRQIRLREREYQRDRLDLSDDHEPIRVRGVNDIPDIDLS